MNIHFVGYLKTFVKEEFELLRKDYTVTEFDLMIHASSFWQIPQYIISSLNDWKNVRRSDVVWIWVADYPAIPFILLAKIFKKRIIVNISGFEVYAAPVIGYGNQLYLIRGAVSRWILRNSTRIIVMSNAYKKIVTELVPGTNVIVIPGWVDTKLCEEPLQEKHGVVTSLTNYKVVHLVKNIPLFINATKGMDAKIIENVPYASLISALKSAKVYCQLSYTESFCVAVLEAMACGCIPVVTDRDALPEVVGDVGFIVPYGDIEKTRDAIQLALLSTPADIQAVRDRARMFSIERRNSEVKKMLKDVILK
jgi:glycosyltransferase involved in cell wall biosynthesis